MLARFHPRPAIGDEIASAGGVRGDDDDVHPGYGVFGPSHGLDRHPEFLGHLLGKAVAVFRGR